MTTIGTLTSATPVNYTGAVSSDTLLFYCASRIHSIDDQTQLQFEKQQSYRAVTQCANSLNEKLTNIANHPPDENDKVSTSKQCEEIEAVMDDAIKAAPEGSQLRATLQEKRDRFHKTNVDQCGLLSKDEVTAYATEFNDLSKQLGSSAELDMINLQSLVSQRQTAIQLVTNMMSSLNESQKAVAAKIGS